MKFLWPVGIFLPGSWNPFCGEPDTTMTGGEEEDSEEEEHSHIEILA